MRVLVWDEPELAAGDRNGGVHGQHGIGKVRNFRICSVVQKVLAVETSKAFEIEDFTVTQ